LGINSTIIQRGFYGTKVSFHNTDGYDGISKLDSRVSLYFGLEEMNNVFYSVQNRFEFDNDAFTEADGYHQVIKDTLTTDLSFSDAQNIGFNSYDFAGWHRTSPVDLLSGACVGSYIGGEQHCADGYGGVGMMVRGMNLQEKNNQRQEVLLSVTGEPVCLIKRVHTGITCSCYQPSSEYADERCPYCLGTKFKLGYEQYFNPRRSDGRLMVSFGNADEDLKMTEAGLESEFMPECWTLTVPTIKDRDIIVRFNRDGTEDEFRYEVLSVSRNRTVLDQQGAQKFKIQRVRKFDPIYKIPVFRNTEYVPQTINTTTVSSHGIAAHSHTIVANEGAASGFAQMTSTSAGHNHSVQYDQSTGTLVVLPTLGHQHKISL
jgi:hypothetical protein